MQTITYSRVGDLDIKLNLEVPRSATSGELPAVIYFHGGGLAAGSRRDVFFPSWLKEGVLKRGLIFIAADYRLLWPATAFDIIDDMKALFAFLANSHFSEKYLPTGLSLDATRLAVMGASGGAYVARAAAIYAQPKPRSVFSLFGMGGEMLTDHWLAPKTGYMALPGTDHVTAESVAHLLDHTPPPSSDATLVITDEHVLTDDAGRVHLFGYWWRTGELLDYTLGVPLSAKLRALPASERLAAVPGHLHPAIVEANIDATFPPTVFVHGLADTVVLPSESQATYDRLRELGVKAELHLIPDAVHGNTLLGSSSSELAPGASEAQERAIDFLERELRRQ